MEPIPLFGGFSFGQHRTPPPHHHHHHHLYSLPTFFQSLMASYLFNCSSFFFFFFLQFLYFSFFRCSISCSSVKPLSRDANLSKGSTIVCAEASETFEVEKLTCLFLLSLYTEHLLLLFFFYFFFFTEISNLIFFSFLNNLMWSHLLHIFKMPPRKSTIYIEVFLLNLTLVFHHPTVLICREKEKVTATHTRRGRKKKDPKKEIKMKRVETGLKYCLHGGDPATNGADPVAACYRKALLDRKNDFGDDGFVNRFSVLT